MPSILKDCGIMLEPQLGMGMKELVDAARLADRLGFGYLFRSDHLLPTDGRRGIASPECWTSLGVVAASTETVKFGPMVSPIGFRNPALLSKMACTLHSFSGGRLQLAVGAGWYDPEYKALGYPFPGFSERVAQFREALDIVLKLVKEGRADYDGKYLSAHTDCLPRPSGDMNVIVGAKAPALVRVAARQADEWNVFVSPKEDFDKMMRAFRGALDGRRVAVSETGPFLLGKGLADLEANARLQARKFGSDAPPSEVISRLKKRGAACGDVDEFVEAVRAKLDLGVSRLYFQTLVPENTAMTELLADTLKQRV